MFNTTNELVKRWGFKEVCILTILRDENHPLKPVDYKSPSTLWQHWDFFKKDLNVKFDWLTIQEDKTVKNEENIMEFWTRPL